MNDKVINSPLGAGGKLTIASRILVAFASGALVAVFFLPAWRIDLFAPQYPEGLMMNIWINNITGDVEIINGLNHYIGMKHITVDMFPEFKYLPYVVGFFMLLGMIVAISGSRKLLFVYVTLTVIGGALAMYDFYQWGYDYGHNLDPKAPIQVAGLSYQPPLFGHKRLLNFDAYSFPDVGGWIVIGAGLLAAGVLFAEWYMRRKRARNSTPAFAIFSLLIFFFISCNTKAEPFVAGKDDCYACKMGISDTRYGAELITKKGKIYKFDDLHCLAGFLQSGTLAEKDIAETLTINFEKPNSFLDINKAFFLVGPEIKSPMGSNAAGFETKDDALAYKKDSEAEVLNWSLLYQKLNN
jgi:copper chaperone NosL